MPKLPDTWADTPDFGLLGNFSLLGSWDRVGFVAALLFVFTLLLADFFDTMGTMTAIGAEAGLLDEDGHRSGAQRILVVDSIAAAAGGAASVSSNTSYIESASGVGEGARTGLASVVTGVLFLLATFLAPLVAIVPYEAATPALVVVGFLMMTQVRGIDWDDLEIAIPAFLTIVLMPFTYSITVGIGAGFVTYVLIKVGAGQDGAGAPAALGGRRRCSSCTSRSTRWSSCSGWTSRRERVPPRAAGTAARSAAGPGRPKCQPWPWSTPRASRVAASAAVSTPSATTEASQPCAKSTRDAPACAAPGRR